MMQRESSAALVIGLDRTLGENRADDLSRPFGAAERCLELAADRIGSLTVERAHDGFDIAACRPVPRCMNDERSREHREHHEGGECQTEAQPERPLCLRRRRR